MDQRFTRVKARYLLLWFIVTTILAIVAVGAAGMMSSLGSKDADGVRAEAGLAWLSYVLLLVTTVLYAGRAGVGFGSSFGMPPGPAQAAGIAALGIPLVAGAIIIMYTVFAPLSLLWPEAIQWWLFDYTPTLYSAEKPYPFAANLLGLSAIVAAAPITEEWFFRGLLLRRLALKWGTVAGVVVSSVVFGLMHADIVGATLFGILMCALYARTGSLWAPTIAHAANNAIAAGFIVLGAHGVVDTSSVTVEELRAYWVAPFVALAFAAPWIPAAWTSWRPMRQWQFGPSAGRSQCNLPDTFERESGAAASDARSASGRALT
jgi:uncharacterized protein